MSITQGCFLNSKGDRAVHMKHLGREFESKIQYFILAKNKNNVWNWKDREKIEFYRSV